ncbi:hypothetical protein JOM56_009666 [Amanita muscaria]
MSLTVTELKGWHTRALAHPHPDPHSFIPQRANLELAMLKSSMGNPQGFILAIFSAKDDGNNDQYVVVDCLGRVLLLPGTSTDIMGLLELGRQVSPKSWRIFHEITCRPIFKLLVAGRTRSRALRRTSVYGYSQNETRLKKEINGCTHLPDMIYKLFGLLLEGYQGPGTVDRFVIDRVKGVLQ